MRRGKLVTDERYIKEQGFPFSMLFITVFILLVYTYIDFHLFDPLESLFNFVMFSIRWSCLAFIIRTFFKEEQLRKRLNERIREINKKIWDLNEMKRKIGEKS